VENEVRGEDPTQLAHPHAFANGLHRGGVTIREVDAEEAVGFPCGLDYSSNFARISPERLLAKHCRTGFERRHALPRVQRTWRGDHHAIGLQREQLLKRTG